MLIWLVGVGEPLPIDPDGKRLYRCGMLAEALVTRGHSVVWWTSTFSHPRKKQRYLRDATAVIWDDKCALRMIYAPAYRKNVSVARLLHHIVLAQRFGRVCRKEPQPDVVLCSLPLIELSFASAEYGAEFGVPVVVDVRDLWPDQWLLAVHPGLRRFAEPLLFWYRAAVGKSCRLAQALVAVSETYLQWGLRHAGRSRSVLDRVFPLGYDESSVLEFSGDDSFGDEIRRRFSIPNNSLVLCFSGTMGLSYDLETVIDAARLLQNKGEDRVRIVIAGDGDAAARLRKRAEGLGSVVLTGWLGLRELWGLLRTSSIGLAPYVNDTLQTLPNKIFEYMAAGLPILSSLKGECEQMLRDEGIGLSYQAGDAESLADAIQRLLKDPAVVAGMAERARKLFQSRFSAQVVYPVYAQYLEEIAVRYRAEPKKF
ncbi:MAG: glycosyltransferase family 4 protein [Armatimonadota bacterium]